MSSVIVGSARIDENGKAHGGKAGDQTGKEVSTQSWYLHSKGWRVFRAIDPNKGDAIAYDMRAACDNSNIGYDQYERNSLYKVAEKVGFDTARVKTKCETDCSALVRVCCAYAGIMDLPSDFRTGNMPKYLLESGYFIELTGDKYTKKSDYLCKGDILVTRSTGHTVVVLTDGPKAYETEYIPGDRPLKKGCEGSDVKQVQLSLITLGYSLPKYGVDGEYGSETEKAVKQWQADTSQSKTGALTKEQVITLCRTQPQVRILGNTVNIRSAPSRTGAVIGIAKMGEIYPYDGEQKTDDRMVEWYLIEFKNKNGWVSSRYSVLI